MNGPQPAPKRASATYVMDAAFTNLTITDEFGRKTIIFKNGSVSFTGSDKEEKMFEAGTRKAQIVLGGMHALLGLNHRVKRELFTQPHVKIEPSKFVLWPAPTR